MFTQDDMRNRHGGNFTRMRNAHVPTWVTHDVQLTWKSPWGGSVIVGARNVMDKDPPLFIGNIGSRDYDFNLYDGYGRTPYIRYQQTFSN
jgi:iron complex outermembrane receptor protein